MQIHAYRRVQPCVHSPPALQLYGSSNVDAESDGELGSFLQSALQELTANTVLWLQNPSDAVPGGSQLGMLGQHNSTQHGGGVSGQLARACPKYDPNYAGPVGCRSSCALRVPVSPVLAKATVERAVSNQVLHASLTVESHVAPSLVGTTMV